MPIDAVSTLDAKLVTLCTVASALLGLSGAILHPGGARASAIFWVAAMLCWALAIGSGLWSYRSQDVEVLSPAKLADGEWLSLTKQAYYFYTIQDLGASFEKNRAWPSAKPGAFS